MSASLAIRGLEVRHDGRAVLRGVDLDVAPGEICALMGPSGSGKSTILRSVAALQSFTAGAIRAGDFELAPGAIPKESALKGLRSRVGMVFQAHALFEHLTALDNVTLAPVHVFGWSLERARSVAMELLDELGVAARSGALPRELSGGEAQRVAIARALAPGPQLLLMDEPTAALDPARRGALGQTLRELAARGRSLLVATHDVELVEFFAHRVAILSGGEIVEEGIPADVLTQPRHDATRALLHGPQGAPQPASVPPPPRIHGKEH